MKFAKNKSSIHKNPSRPIMLPQILHPRDTEPIRRLKFPSRDDPNYSQGLGKRHYTLNNATSLQKILNPQATNRIKIFRSQTKALKNDDQKKPNIVIDFKLKPLSDRKIQRFSSEGAEVNEHSQKIRKQFEMPFQQKLSPQPKYVQQLMLKKIGPSLPNVSSRTYDLRQKMPTYNDEILDKKLKLMNNKTEQKQKITPQRRMATQLNNYNSETSRLSPENRQSRIQYIKYFNPTYLSTGTYL